MALGSDFGDGRIRKKRFSRSPQAHGFFEDLRVLDIEVDPATALRAGIELVKS